jgi:hypothetical protein
MVKKGQVKLFSEKGVPEEEIIIGRQERMLLLVYAGLIFLYRYEWLQVVRELEYA